MANATKDTVSPILDTNLANLSSCMFSGVFTAVLSVLFRATFPISVASPMAVTTASPLPDMTIEERSTTLRG